jgi:CHAT domain-containing protein
VLASALTYTARSAGSTEAEAYELVWRDKAALGRRLDRRRLLGRLTTPAGRSRAEELLEVRQKLARLLLSPAAGGAGQRPALLGELSERKERLERELARLDPEAGPLRGRPAGPAELLAALPPRAAFVDLYAYGQYHLATAQWGRGQLAAFVLTPGGPPRRVELGPLSRIGGAVDRWRADVAAGRDGPAAAELRRLVWEKIAGRLPADTDTVYLAPGGPLSDVPWAALPGRRPGTVLLEDHALALVPHGDFLLGQLRGPAKAAGPGTLLAVGGVAYDDAPAEAARAGAVRAADAGGGRLDWPALPGTGRELARVAELARALDPPPRVVERRGAEASVARLVRDLPAARWAHLATHGFFAAGRSAERRALLDERDFARGVGRERRGAGARNPLVQTGLVLAGANRPRQDPDDDGGLLTAEAVAGLDLAGMELAVLSACQTGLGEATDEGLYGLQRAFHLGGCKNVVASLWPVDDEVTAALMALFYHHLWVGKQAPLQALRSAQLQLRRNPAELPLLAKERAPNLNKVVQHLEQKPAPVNRAGETAPVRHWAAFVLSGAGR